jgi:DNA-binding NtrC family response regulator
MATKNGLILIVDDEPELVSNFAELLETMSFTTLTAGNGQRALELYKERHEDITLVFCDISMPTLDGLSFFKQALVAFGYLPIVMVTAHTDIGRVTEALRLGALDYIVKPFDPLALEQQIFIWQEVGHRNRENLKYSTSPKADALLRAQSSEIGRKRKTS